MSNIYISKGNKKLAPNAKVKYMIFNLPAQKTCPFATELCKKSCYAKKAEKCYPSVLPCRENNYNASIEDDFINNMIEAIEKMLKTPSYTKAKHVIFRIHESGDFYSQEYVNKWKMIIDYFKPVKKLQFVAYTKSIEYFRTDNYWKNMENITLIHSIWNDTDINVVHEIIKNNLKYYTACGSNEWNSKPQKEKCYCKNCSTCFKCFTNNENYNNLYCEIH